MSGEKEEIEDELYNIEKQIENLDAQRQLLLHVLGNMNEVKA